MTGNTDPNGLGSQLPAFLAALAEVICDLQPPERLRPGQWLLDRRWWGEPHFVERMWTAVRYGEAPVQEVLDQWLQMRQALLSRFWEGDTLALDCMLCNGDDRWQATHDALQNRNVPKRFTYLYRPEMIWQTWLVLHPPPEAEERLVSSIRKALHMLRRQDDGDGRTEPAYRLSDLVAILPLVEFWRNPEQPDLARSRLMLTELGLPVFATVRPLLPAPPGVGHAQTLVPYLAAWGALSNAELDAILLADPELSRLSQQLAHFTGWRRALGAAHARFLQRLLDGEENPAWGQVVWQSRQFAGIDHIRLACQFLQRYPSKQPPTTSYPGKVKGPLQWVPLILTQLARPTEEDLTQCDQLAHLPPDVLLTAVLYSPAAARWIEGPLGYSGLAGLVDWLHHASQPGPWSTYSPDEARPDDPGILDRAAALAVCDQLGEERLRQVLDHPVSRKLYRTGRLYLESVLGRNRDEVEAGILQRQKEAVRALGLLPVDDGGLDCYLRLRGFAREARKMKPRRRNTEATAAQSGLANLARNLGYADSAQMEWAMEARIAGERNPEGQRWMVGDYTLWVEAGERAAFRVQRGDKRLRSVPAAVRQDPVYQAIKEARELLDQQRTRTLQLLEKAMISSEDLPGRLLAPLLMAAAGRASLPCLVLRCRLAGARQPVDLLGFRTLAGEPVAPERIEALRVAHPLDLQAARTLGQWQRSAVERGIVQPFNQLFREVYTPIPSELRQYRSRRLWGRPVRSNILRERLQQRGWRLEDQSLFVHQLPDGLTVQLCMQEGAVYTGGNELLVVGDVEWYLPDACLGNLSGEGRVNWRLFSEAMRDLDLATWTAMPHKGGAISSREKVASRAALVRAWAPEVRLEGDAIHAAEHILCLEDAGVSTADGQPVSLPDLPAPAMFPYRQPDTITATLIARLDHLRGTGVLGDKDRWHFGFCGGCSTRRRRG